MQLYRLIFFWVGEAVFLLVFSEKGLGVNYARNDFKKVMAKQLKGDKHLVEGLVPEYGIGCKRITPSDVYLKSKHGITKQGK